MAQNIGNAQMYWLQEVSMRSRNKLAGMIALVFAAFALPAHAEYLRCKGDLAEIGDGKASVLQKCGEPVYKDTYCKASQVVSNTGNAPGSTTVNVLPCEQVDEWTYNPGPGQFLTILRFERGELRSIKYGDRVK
ncbi:DUF2845 domain-containing protein [Chitinimonas arctica]|uniref:DUF2845 domain-containing protein n=1 Tax=Chitinimonas arctica TaxID=2594795 RepID=A0A516SH55_9NEIS|nr:DUF2845 domain-containing protein [Chitinimonas arctica]QDQ27497.1 DUF2845 domain-containing protein [Chitinimonas arctica]